MIKNDRMNFTFQMSIRGLMFVTLVFAVLIAACGYIVNRQMGYGVLKNHEDWPRAFKSLLESNKEFQSEVTLYGLGDFIDHRSIWRIKRESEFRGALAECYELIPTTYSHPKAAELIDSIPRSWGIENPKNFNWYTTPGYGSTHIEGSDLFLVADDPETGETIVLHEWLF